MFRFFVKTAGLMIVLLIGIIIGMQEAHTGILKMSGYDDLRFKNVLDIEKTEDGEMEAIVLGEQISSHHLEEKKKILEDLNANHILTDLTKGFNEFFSDLITKILPE